MLGSFLGGGGGGGSSSSSTSTTQSDVNNIKGSTQNTTAQQIGAGASVYNTNTGGNTLGAGATLHQTTTDYGSVKDSFGFANNTLNALSKGYETTMNFSKNALDTVSKTQQDAMRTQADLTTQSINKISALQNTSEQALASQKNFLIAGVVAFVGYILLTQFKPGRKHG